MKINLNLTLFTLLFVTLKLTHVINWKWFWVLSPTLIPLGLMLTLWSFLVFYYAFLESPKDRAYRHTLEILKRNSN